MRLLPSQDFKLNPEDILRLDALGGLGLSDGCADLDIVC